MIQEDVVNQYMEVPLFINIMASEDRSGRSGDHIPFRRNGSVLASLANSPDPVTCSYTSRQAGIIIRFDQDFNQYDGFLVGIRYNKSHSHKFDEVKYFASAEELSVDLGERDRFYVSVSPVKDGYRGQFSEEFMVNLLSVSTLGYASGVNIQPNAPNPWSDHTSIRIEHFPEAGSNTGELIVQDLTGRIVWTKDIVLNPGENEITVAEKDLHAGVYFYSLRQDNQRSESYKMVKIK